MKFLEFQWGPSKGLQEEVYQLKRTVLLQKLSRRVEEIKAKEAAVKIQPENKDSPAARKWSEPEESQPLTCKAKTKLVPQLKTHKSKGGPAEQRQTSERPGFIKQKKAQPSPAGVYSLFNWIKLSELKYYSGWQKKLQPHKSNLLFGFVIVVCTV